VADEIDKVERFLENEQRFRDFVNNPAAPGTGYTSDTESGAIAVPSLQKFISDATAEVTDLANEVQVLIDSSDQLNEDIAAMTAASAEAETIQAQWGIGMPISYKFDASLDVGTDPEIVLEPDDSRIGLWLYNADNSGGRVTISVEDELPVYGNPGTFNLNEGDAINFESTDTPQKRIRAIADQASTGLTVRYSSTIRNAPGLLKMWSYRTTPADSTLKTQQRDLWNAFLDAGVDISKLSHFSIIDPTEQGSLLNWVDGTVSVNNGMTFLADRYLKGNGTSNYIATGKILPDLRYVQNSHVMGLFTKNAANDLGNTQYMMSNSTGGISPHRSTISCAVREQTTTQTITPGGTLGLNQFLAYTRVDSGGYKAYFRDGTINYSLAVTQASIAVTARELFLGAQNNSGTAGNFSSASWICSFAGPGVDNRDVAIPLLDTAIRAFATARGAI